MNVLITGAGGQLGRHLREVFEAEHHVIALKHQELDVRDSEQIKLAFKRFHPDLVIHAAAFTNVDLAENEMIEAFKVNTTGAWNVAIAAREASAKMVYVSSNYVFDGLKGAPYHEQDKPNPINVYGKSKWLGEKFVEMFCPKHYIVRTSWLYSLQGLNFVTKLLLATRLESTVRVVNDQRGSPTYTLDLAKFIAALVESDHYGVVHASNRGCCTLLEWAQKVFELRSSVMPDKIDPISTQSLQLAAKRPMHTCFDDRFIREKRLPRMREWRDALADCLG